jgi:hypothetical protein
MGRQVAVALVFAGSVVLIAAASIQLARFGIVWLIAVGVAFIAIGLFGINVDDKT